MSREARRGRQWLAVIVGLFTLLAAISSLVVPPFETPDEIWHYAYIQQLASGGGLPVSEVQTEGLWRQQGAQPPAYYLLAALITAPIPQDDFPARYASTNPHVALGIPGATHNLNLATHDPLGEWPVGGSLLAVHVSRFLSVLLGAGTVIAIHATLRPLIGQSRALWAAAFWAFIPQMTFISGAVSNDNMINLMATLVVWRLVLWVQRPAGEPASTRDRLILGLLLGGALLSKISALWLLPLTAIALALRARLHGGYRSALRDGLWVYVVALLVSGWWFARNLVLYGDALATNIWLGNILLRDAPLPFIVDRAELVSLERSFWGLFGWFNVPYPDPLYQLLRGVAVLILVGGALAFWRWSRRLDRVRLTPRRAALLLLALWPLFLTLSWLAFMRLAPAAQGRYFQPAATSLALLASVGLTAWPGVRRGLMAAVVAALFLLSAMTPWLLIRPTYAAAVPLDAMPAPATPYPVTYGPLQLEGYEVTVVDGAPEPRLDLTLYWRAIEPVDTDYSLSVKVLGEGGAAVAVHDSYPDGGRWPTRFIPPGRLIADRHLMVLDAPPGDPAVARVELDVYRFHSQEPLTAMVSGEPTEPLHLFFLRFQGPAVTVVPGYDFTVRPDLTQLAIEDDRLEIDFVWQVGQMVGRDYQAFLHLVEDENSGWLANGDFAPLQGEWPTSVWWFGSRYPDRATLPLPRDLPPGEYQVIMGLYHLGSLERLELEPGSHSWPLATLSWDGTQWRESS